MAAFLTTKEVAELLGVPIGKVTDWLLDGSLIGVNIARHAGGIRPRWRISRAALEAFIASRQTQPPAPAPRKRREQEVTAYY